MKVRRLSWSKGYDSMTLFLVDRGSFHVRRAVLLNSVSLLEKDLFGVFRAMRQSTLFVLV